MVTSKDTVADYQEYLEQVGKSANTVGVYVYDVAAFASWFEQTTSTALEKGIRP